MAKAHNPKTAEGLTGIEHVIDTEDQRFGSVNTAMVRRMLAEIRRLRAQLESQQ